MVVLDKEAGNVMGLGENQWVSLGPTKGSFSLVKPPTYPEETILVKEGVQVGNRTRMREGFAGFEAGDLLKEDLILCYADEEVCR